MNLSQDHVKVIDKAIINDNIVNLKLLLGDIDPNGISEIIDKLQLHTALLYFHSSNLEKRLSGLNDIKSFIRKVSDDDMQFDNDQPWLTKEYLSSFFFFFFFSTVLFYFPFPLSLYLSPFSLIALSLSLFCGIPHRDSIFFIVFIFHFICFVNIIKLYKRGKGREGNRKEGFF